MFISRSNTTQKKHIFLTLYPPVLMTILSFVEFLEDGWVSIVGNQCIQQNSHSLHWGERVNSGIHDISV